MAIIGTAYVNIRAVTSQIEKDIQKQLSGPMRDAGTQAGKEINEGIRSETSKMELGSDSINTKKATDKAGKDVKRDLSKILKEPMSLGEFRFNTEAAARTASQKLVDELNKNLKRAGLNLPAPKVLPGSVLPDPDTTAATFINRFRARLNAGEFALPEPDVSDAADNAGRKFSSRFARTLATTARNAKLEIEPKVNLTKFKRDVDEVVTIARDGGSKAGDGLFSSLGKGEISSILQRLFYQILFGIPVVGALVGALSSLTSGLFALGSAIAPATGSLAVIPGLLSAIVTPVIAATVAFQGIGDAYSAGVDALSGSAEDIKKFKEELKNISPAAGEFVKQLISMKDRFDGLRDAAGADLFPRLTTALQTLVNGGFLDALTGGLQTAGRALGDVAVQMANLFVNNQNFVSGFANVMASNETVIRNLGTGLVNLASLFITIADAARPFTEAFSAWVATVTGNWAASAQTNFTQLQDFIGRGVAVVKQLWDIFKGLIDAIQTLGSAAAPAGQSLLDSFQEAVANLNEFLNAPGRGQQLIDYFADVAENVKALSSLAADVAAAFIMMGDDPAVAEIANVLRTEVLPVLAEVLETVTDQVGPHMAEVVGEIVGVFGSIANSGGLNAFLTVIGELAAVLNDLTKIPGFAGFVTGLATFIGAMKAANFVAQVTGLRNLGSAITGVVSATRTGVLGVVDFANGLRGISTTVDGQVTAMSRFGTALRNLPGNIRNAASATAEFVSGQAALIRQQAGAARAFAVDGISRFGGALKTAAVNVGTFVAAQARLLAQQARVAASFAVGQVRTFASTLASAGRAAATAAVQMGTWIATQARAAAATAVTTARVVAQRIATVAAAAAQNAVKIATAAWTAVQWLLNAALNANPLGLIVIAITAVIAAIVLLWQNSETFRNIVLSVWAAVQTAISAVASWFTGTLVPWIQGAWDAIVSGVQTAWNWVLTTIQTVGNAIVQFFLNWTLAGLIIQHWETIKNAVVTAWNFVLNIITTVGSAIASFFSSLWSGISTTVSTVWNGIVVGIQIYVQTVFTVISTVFNAISSFLSGIWNGIRNTALSVWSSIVSGISNFVNGLRGFVVGAFNGIRDGIVSAFSGIGSAIAGALSGLVGIVRGPVNAVVRAVNSVIRAINGISVDIPDWVPGLGGSSFGVNIPQIPQMAKGGVVSATPGGMLANLAEAGRDERVTPLDANGMSAGENAMLAELRALSASPRGNIIIQIQAPPDIDTATLAKMVARELQFSGG